MLSIKDKYEYNQKDLLDWNSETSVLTFKGRVKEFPNEVVNIKIIPNAYGKIYEEEVQKLESQEKDGLIAIVKRIRNGQNFYLIFSNVIGLGRKQKQPPVFSSANVVLTNKPVLNRKYSPSETTSSSASRSESPISETISSDNTTVSCSPSRLVFSQFTYIKIHLFF